ncbi:hypothetical protein [Roseicyclus sp.]
MRDLDIGLQRGRAVAPVVRSSHRALGDPRQPPAGAAARHEPGHPDTGDKRKHCSAAMSAATAMTVA